MIDRGFYHYFTQSHHISSHHEGQCRTRKNSFPIMLSQMIDQQFYHFHNQCDQRSHCRSATYSFDLSRWAMDSHMIDQLRGEERQINTKHSKKQILSCDNYLNCDVGGDWIVGEWTLGFSRKYFCCFNMQNRVYLKKLRLHQSRHWF